MDLYRFSPGPEPILVSVPHAGTKIPDDIRPLLTPEAAALPDTDWHVDRLYDFASEVGASFLVANYSRYVVDLNRAPDDRPLYPGADNTEVCPTRTFANEPIYRHAPPDRAEIDRRLNLYWHPYHAKIAEEIGRLKQVHKNVVLFDAHSIASVVPRFFEGTLPVFNLGTAQGISADRDLAERMLTVLENASPDWPTVLNGRFTGGYITRTYGRPGERVHAVQLEMAERAYMDEGAPYRYRDDLAQRLVPVLRRLIETARDWARQRNREG